MSSLADISKLVGFFSYSREDDQGSRGALSALRDAIQSELSAQLGRSQTDFRVWQDKAAISLGTLWEKQIAQGIQQAVFFIPIVTPRALRSQHCAFEFQAFLAREAELARDDLVFPILYIPVSALEDEKVWREDPILRIVGTRQYLDWREFRHRDPQSIEVRQKLELFCRGITNALHKPWESPQERQRREEAEARQRTGEELRRKTAEIEAKRLAREERQRQEAEAARRAEEAERARLAEEEARQRAAEERRRLKVAAEKEAQEERAFKTVAQSNNVATIEAFLAAHPDSRFGREAQMLKAALRAREDAYSRATASDDPVVLRSFCDAYKKGRDVEQVRAQLRLIAPEQERQRPNKIAIIASGALATILVGAVGVWFAMRPSAESQQVAVRAPQSAAAATARLPPPPAAQPAPSAPPETKLKVTDTAPTVVVPAPLAPAVAPGPGPDELAWSLLKDTTDAAALRRFTAQFPDSSLRKDAETRMAALAAEQAAWNLVKDSKDPDQLREFISQFPHSADRANAEQRIAALSVAAPTTVAVSAPDPHELARSLQFELMRVGCFVGKVTGDFDDDTKAAWHKFIKLTSKNMPDDASSDAINAVRGINKRVCPLICPHGEHAEGNVCVANEPPPPPKHTVRREAPAPARAPTPAAAAPASNTYCQSRASGVAISSSANVCN